VAATPSPQRYRLEQWLSNSRCDKNASSAILNVSLQDVAETISERQAQLGINSAVVFPQIPPLFAFELGRQFEAELMDGEQPNLLSRMLVSQGLITEAVEVRFESRTPSATTEEHLNESKRLLSLIASSGKNTAWVISGFKLPAKVLPPESTFEIDLLVAIPSFNDQHELLIGEVKIYPDKGGRTNPVQIAGARSQAGLYVYVLQKWLTELEGLEALKVDGRGFLVFSNPSDGMPKIAAIEDLAEQHRRAEIAIQGITALYENPEIQNLAQANNADEKIAFVESQKDEFRESCWGHCSMAEICFRKLVASDRSLLLGAKTEQQLSALALSRAAGMADGQIGPIGDVEIDLANRFEDAKFPEVQGLTWK